MKTKDVDEIVYTALGYILAASIVTTAMAIEVCWQLPGLVLDFRGFLRDWWRRNGEE